MSIPFTLNHHEDFNVLFTREKVVETGPSSQPVEREPDNITRYTVYYKRVPPARLCIRKEGHTVVVGR